MSQLWEQCLGRLRRQVPAEEWEHYFEHLRGWMDAGTLYIWVDSHLDVRTRAEILGHLASARDTAIRKVANRVKGGEPVRVRYERHPPNQERIVNERRMREHRESELRRLRAECAEFRKLQIEEYRKLVAEGAPRLRGTSEQQKQRLLQIIDARALRRLEEQSQAPRPIRASRRRERGEPPESPPLWPPDASRESPQ